MYLIRNRGSKQKAHIWTGKDTVCRMWSTGGMKQKSFTVNKTTLGKDLCLMCSHIGPR